MKSRYVLLYALLSDTYLRVFISQDLQTTLTMAMDFFDILMDGLEELNELNEYLGQPNEKVRDPVARLSMMALDYLSVPGR